jgi:hypothetical protein
MAHLRDTSFGLPRISRHRLAWLVALPLLILTLPAQSDANLDQAPDGTATAATAIAAPATSAPADPAVKPAAATTPAARPEPDDRQRRVLMLLLMNSAGPVRPYGNLGR